MGSSSPKKAKETAQERANAAVASAQLARYKQIHKPHEAGQLAKVQQDMSGLLQGRGIADVAQAQQGQIGGGVQAGSGSARALLGSTTGVARGKAAIAGDTNAQSVRDQGTLGVLKIGLDMSSDASVGLSHAAKASSQEAIGLAQAQSTTNNAFMGVLGTVAGAGAAKYAAGKQATRLSDQRKTFQTNRDLYGTATPKLSSYNIL